MGDFAHLHVHTEYSMLDGASRVGGLMEAVERMGMKSVAMTDHGVMFGAIDFHTQARKRGINPIIGCLLEGQPIITAEGMIPIEGVKVGDRVLTHKGRFRSVTNTMRRPYRGRAFTVKLGGNNAPVLTLTEEHPILVRTHDGRVEWTKPGDIDVSRPAPGRGGSRNWTSYACLPKLASDLTTIDVLAHIPDMFGVSETGSVTRPATKKFEADLDWVDLPAVLPLTCDFAYLLGLFAAEGSLGRLNGRLTGAICLSLNIDEGKLADRVDRALEAFGVRLNRYERVERNSLEVTVGLLPLAYLLDSLVGCGAASKRVPEAILRAERSVRAAFLEGLLDGDGKNPDRPTNLARQQTLKVASPHLAWGARTIMGDLGHWCSVKRRHDPGRIPCYVVAYSPHRSYSRTLDDEQYVYRPIVAVDEIVLDTEVFNVEVAEDNSYVSDFVLHNCELYLAPGNRRNTTDMTVEGKRYYHLIALAENAVGYRNLMKLTSRAYTEGYWYKPRVDRELLAEHAEGLIILSGCLGSEVNQKLLAGNYDEARNTAGWYKDTFGDSYFVELQDHGIPEQGQTNGDLIRIAKSLDVPLVVTNDSHYTERSDFEAHDALLCVQTGALKSDTKRFKFHNDQFYVKPAEQMQALFPDEPGTWKNTLLIAERCDVRLDSDQMHLPRFTCPEGHDEKSYLREKVRAGAVRRYGAEDDSTSYEGLRDEVKSRIEYELGVIEQMGFSAYFLIVADLIDHAREVGIRVGPGRGSAAGCAVSYCAGITDLDPIRHGLLFERFLNPERISMPDIDMDFDERRRGEMIRYTADKYGQDHVAQIVTFQTIKAKQAIKDASRVLGLPYAFGDRLCKMFPPAVQGKESALAEALAQSGELAESRDTNPDAKKVLELAAGLEGLRRQHSIHAAGVVIADEPITDIVPTLQVDGNAEVVTQYDGRQVEDLGLLKMDFLGLRNLTIISDALEHIEMTTGEKVDVDNMPLDDAATYALISRGETDGVFQLESSGYKSLCKRMKPDRFEDITALGALFRPGPMSANLHTGYADRKNGVEKVSYIHPDVTEILEESYGLLIYQEQVQKIAQRIAGFSLGQADMIRKAIGKKLRDKMDALKGDFVDGTVASGYPKKLGDDLWSEIEGFASYAFNKSHSAAYGMVTYQTAWLKAHYPVEYMAALLTSVKNNKDKLPAALHTCRTMGIEVLVPDINDSLVNFAPVVEADGGRPRQIRFGMSAVRNVGEHIVGEIIAARRAGGVFADFHDFVDKVPLGVLNKRTIESLVKAGAFESLGHPRRGLQMAIESIIDNALAIKRKEDEGQYDLFGGLGGAADDSVEMEAVPIPDLEYDRKEKLAAEREMLGLYVSDHPLLGLERALSELATASMPQVHDLKGGADVTIAGLLTAVTKKFTKKGESYVVGTIEDLQGGIEVMFFPSCYGTYADLLVEDEVLVVQGRIDDGRDVKQVIADRVSRPDLSEATGAPLVLRVHPRQCAPEMVARLREVLIEHAGSVPVQVTVADSSRSTDLTVPEGLSIRRSQGLFAELKMLLGTQAVS